MIENGPSYHPKVEGRAYDTKLEYEGQYRRCRFTVEALHKNPEIPSSVQDRKRSELPFIGRN